MGLGGMIGRMFGGGAAASPGAQAAIGQYDPSQATGADRMMMLGAMLRDTGSSLRGGDSQGVLQMQQMLAQRQLMGSVLGSMDGDQGGAPPMLAGGAPGPQASTPMSAQPPTGGQPPPASTSAGPRLNQRALRVLSLVNPQAARALIEQQKFQSETFVAPDGSVHLKYDPSMVGQVFGNPQAVNNTVLNMNDPRNVNRVIPSAPVAGAMPVYNNQGEVTDWTLPKGAQQAIAAAQAPTIEHNRAMERIGGYEAGTGRMNAGINASSQQNTASQNTVLPPAGFTVRPRRR